MKIYKLTLNEKADEPMAMTSSYITPRREMKVEFYASRAKAEKRRDDIYDGLTKLVGFFPKVEAVITEIEVIE